MLHYPKSFHRHLLAMKLSGYQQWSLMHGSCMCMHHPTKVALKRTLGLLVSVASWPRGMYQKSRGVFIRIKLFLLSLFNVVTHCLRIRGKLKLHFYKAKIKLQR
jgi:hypothetical protein